MASVSLTARRLRVLIGTDEQDWTRAAGTFSPARDSLGETGYLTIRASLELLAVPAPESLDVRLNPARWRPGTPVRVQIQDGTGAYVDHPFGRLFILKDPDIPDSETGAISLDLGCKLAWAAQGPPPEGDASGVTYGTADNCATIASRLLQASAIASGDINLGTWPYNTAVPLPKEGGGSYAQQAGELAYSNDYRNLYQDTAGTIRAQALNTLPAAAPVLTITLGLNDAGLDRFRDPQDPAELVRCAGPGVILDSVENPITSRTVENEPLDDDTDAERITTTSESFVYNPPTSVTTTSNTRILEDFELARITTEKTRGKAVKEDRTEVTTWDATAGPPHRLVQRVSTLRQDRGVINPNEVNNETAEGISSRTTITPTYNAEEQITQIRTVQEDVEVLHDPNGNNPYALKEARITTQTWTQLGSNRWQLRTTVQTARIVANPNVTDNFWSKSSKTTIETSNTGSTTPPATEFWEGPYDELNKEYRGEVPWVHPGGATGRERVRLFTIPYGFSDAQMRKLAGFHRDLLEQRQDGAIIPLPITDGLLAVDVPLFPVWVVDGTTTYKYLCDSLSFAHERQQAAAAAIGILQEIVVNGTPLVNLNALQDAAGVDLEDAAGVVLEAI